MYVLAEMIYDGICKMPSACLALEMAVTITTTSIRSARVHVLLDF